MWATWLLIETVIFFKSMVLIPFFSTVFFRKPGGSYGTVTKKLYIRASGDAFFLSGSQTSFLEA